MKIKILDLKTKILKTLISQFIIILLFIINYTILSDNCFSQLPFWEKTGDIYGCNVSSITVNPNGEIFAGTNSGSLLRSKDNGDSWTIVNQFYYGISGIKINLSGHIFVAVGNVYRSTDNGGNWTLTGKDNRPGDPRSIAITPNDNIFVITCAIGIWYSTNSGDDWIQTTMKTTNEGRSIVCNSKNHIFASDYDGIHRSTDLGTTWTKINSGLPDNVNPPFLVVNKNDHLFVNTNDGMFRSTNNGDSWYLLTKDISGGSYNSTVITPTGIIYTISNGVYRSTENGDTWECLGLKDTANTCISVNSKGDIFVGTNSDGIYRSTDNGKSWKLVNNKFTGWSFTSLAINSSNYIFCGGNSCGVYRSTNNGNDWKNINPPGGILDNNICLVNSPQNYIYAGAGGVYFSTDNGENWTKTNDAVENEFIYSIAFNSLNHMFAGTSGNGLYRSLDNGNSWSNVIPKDTCTRFDLISINSKNHIFATGCCGCGLYRSTNNGDNWTMLNSQTWVGDYRSLIINNNDFIFTGDDNGHVYRSTDNGDSWTNITLSEGRISYLDVNSKNHIFAATSDSGVYRSTNNGYTWSKLSNGLEFLNVLSLAVDTAGYLYAGTPGRIYRSTISTYNIQPKITLSTNTLTFSTIKNYPLPLAKTFKITNSGYETLNWNITTDANWLIVSKKIGTDSNTITINVNTTNLNPGAYTAKITITDTTASNNPQTINVTYTVGEQPSLVLYTNNLSFSAIQNQTLPMNQTFKINNGGDTTLNWTVSDTVSWLDLNPKSGVDSGTVTASITSTNMNYGQYNTTITISSQEAVNSPQKIDVSYRLGKQPEILLSAKNLNFAAVQGGTLPSNKLATIKNGGEGELNWKIIDDAEWLDITPTMGTDSTVITIGVNKTDLPLGTHTAKITITAEGSSNTPQVINVTYTIGSKPNIVISTNSLTFTAKQNGTIPSGQKFIIENGGVGTLSWSITKDVGWIDINKLTGINVDTITVSITTTNLQPNIYFGKITITAPGATNTPQIINVIYNILGDKPGVITLAATGVNQNSAILNGNVNPVGSSTTAWYEWGTSDSLFSYTTTQSQSIGSGVEPISVTANLTGLNNLTRYYYRLVGSNSAGITKGMILSFRTGLPKIELSTNVIEYKVGKSNSAIAQSKNITIKNTGGGSLNWSIKWNGSWLDISPISGIDSGVVVISVTPANTKDGNYSTTIEISATGAENTPQLINVSYIKDTEAPNIKNHILPSAVSENNVVSITATAEDAVSNIDSFYVYYRKTNESWSETQKATLGKGQSPVIGNAIIPTDMVTKYGLNYKLIAVDAFGNKYTHQFITGLDYNSIEVKIPVGSAFSTATISGTDVGTYRIFSVPYNFSISASSLFGSIGVYKQDWRLLVPQGNNLIDGENVSIDLGTGYFLITKTSKTITLPKEAKTSKLTDYVTNGITLSAGWNLIGNPFDFDIPTTKLSLVNNGTYQSWIFENGWKKDPTSVKRWGGFALYTENATGLKFNLESGVVKLNKNSTTDDMLSIINEELWITNHEPRITIHDNNWYAQIIVDNGKIKDEHNYFGMQELANDGNNKLNIIEPPIFDGGISGYFIDNDNTVKKYYAEYYQPIDEKGSEWQFIVQSKSNEKITLGFKNLENISGQFRKILLDVDRNIIYDLTKQTEIQTTSGNGKRNFQILVGVNSYIELIEQKIQTKPSNFILYQNYPNPFNPLTTIRYGLPIESEINLSIYDTYGRLVSTLVNERKSAGYYEIIYDGNGLSSGIYYYRIICDKFVDTKRLILIK